MNLLKKLTLSFLSAFIVLLSFAPYLTVSAQTTPPAPTDPPAAYWYSPSLFEFLGKVYDTGNNDIFGERYTYAQVVWILESLPFALLGVTPDYFQAVLQYYISNPTGMNVLSDPNSKLAQLKDPFLSIIGQFYSNPPASGTRWLSQKINNFSIVKHAYAQTGFGYNSLAMFQKLWSASRNIAYSVMVIILISIAFAVMFRLKINPQVAVTVQNSLPKIASTLILVTFSYAIVGFLIDFMYLIFGVLVYALSTNANGLGLDPVALFNDFTNGSLFIKIFTSMNSSVVTTGAIGGAGIIGIIIGLIAFAGTVTGAATLALPMLPFVIGIIIAIFIFFFQTFLMLAKVYFSLVINLAFGPIILLAEAIPFIKASAMGWFKSVIADILVFLTVGLIFLIASLLNSAFSVTGVATWSPPYLPFSPFLFKLIIWLAVWSLLPNVKDIVYKMMEKSSFDIQAPRQFHGQGERLWESIMRVKSGMGTS